MSAIGKRKKNPLISIAWILAAILIGMQIAEDTKAPHTGGSADAPLSGSTAEIGKTADRLPNLPASYESHVYLDGRYRGGCQALLGTVKIVVVLVDDSISQWTDADKKAIQKAYEETLGEIRRDATECGQTLDLTIEYITATTTGEPEGQQANNWVDGALESAGLPTQEELNNALEKQYGADEVPVVLCINRNGRSYATNNAVGEYAVLYGDGGALRHELYHLFGAQDYYFPEEVKTLAQEIFTDSVMISSDSSPIDSLTAYNIGWTDTPSDQTKAFLEKTTHITYEILKKAKEQDSYTGEVTDFEMENGTFTGYLRRGVPEGKGTMVYFSGDTYSGEWVGGLHHGQGTITFENGASYTGEWKNHTRHGQGTYTFANGDKYVGAFKEDSFHGQGTYTYASGGHYEGSWKEGNCHGHGTMYYNNGDVYTGDWYEDKRQGQGTYTYASGETLSGTWKNNDFIG